MSDVLTRISSALESRYRITRQAGIGGMATVFLAHDVRHERDVAIKVLHPDLAAALGAERFLAEIKTTAKLQHPHILPLLDSGEADGLLYYVMPFIAGESLRSRLERETQLAVDDAVRIAREVLSALDYAHRHGVVHRDIKPENILIHENQALVADFGIALAVSAAGGARMTQTGLSLGTPQYMAPEQAMGERAIDGRADIYALGAVLYEMLVGEPPFTGPTVQAIVARVMTENPRPVTGQRRSVNANVNAAVMRALEKLPADRFHSAAEFSSALADPGYQPANTVQETTRASAITPRISRFLPWVIAGVAAVAAIVYAIRGRSNRDDAPLYVSLEVPANVALPASSETIGISQDGRTVAVAGFIAGQFQLLVRKLDEDEFRLVPGSRGARGSAAFSQDGKWLAFNIDQDVYRTPVAGGTPTRIAGSRWAQMSWTPDNSVVFTKNYDTGLNVVSFDGRDSASITTPDRSKGELGHWWPQTLPDGDHVMFTNYTTPADKSRIEVVSLKTKERKVILNGAYFGRYVQGRLLFIRNGSVVSMPMDVSGLKVSGTETPVPIDVHVLPQNGWASFDISKNGTIAYLTDAGRRQELFWVSENGEEESAVDSAGKYSYAVPSPDGRKIAVVKDGDLWIIDRARKLQNRLTRTPQPEVDLVWTPDSRTIIYARDVPQYDVYGQPADGSGQEQRILTSANDKEPSAVSPDGTMLIYNENNGHGDDIFGASIAGPAKFERRLVIGGNGDKAGGDFSPDGRWIVYASNESGQSEIYVSPAPGNSQGAKQQVSDGGGRGAEFSPDGRWIYFARGGQIYRASFNPSTAEIGAPEMMKRIKPVQEWYVAPDGRFLVQRTPADAERHSVKLRFNWLHTIDSHK